MSFCPIFCMIEKVRVNDEIIMKSLKHRKVHGICVGTENVVLWLAGHKKIEVPLGTKVKIIRA